MATINAPYYVDGVTQMLRPKGCICTGFDSNAFGSWGWCTDIEYGACPVHGYAAEEEHCSTCGGPADYVDAYGDGVHSCKRCEEAADQEYECECCGSIRTGGPWSGGICYTCRKYEFPDGVPDAA